MSHASRPTTIVLADDLAYARALKAHLARFGRREPGPSSVIDGIEVGRWWHEEILPQAVAGTLETKWDHVLSVAGVDPRLPDPFSEQALLDVASFKAENPHESAPPARWVSPSGLRIGAWVLERSREHAEGRLAPEHEILVRHGVLVDQRLTSFEHMLDDLDEFITTHGHADVPREHVSADGHELGGRMAWVRKRAIGNDLSSEQYLALLRRGVPMSPPPKPKQRSFEEWYALLCQWRREFDGVELRAHEVYAGANLGRWVKRQAALASQGAMSKRRRAMFARVGVSMPEPTAQVA